MTEMQSRGFTPAAEAYCALTVVAKGDTPRQLLAEYDPMALNQAEEAMSRLFRNLTGAEKVSVLPAYSEIVVDVESGPAEGISFRGMVRDMPGLPRRVTNTDSGNEFFVDGDTDIYVRVESYPERRGVKQYAY